MNPMTTTDGQVDQILGSAYQVIKYVAANMEALISLAESVDPLVDSIQTAFEALRRTYTESGYDLLKATFKTGAAIGTRSHVLIDDTTGIAYSWEGALPKFVPEGSTLDSTGGIGPSSWVPRDLTSLRQQLSQPGGVSLVGGAVSDSELEQKVAPVQNMAIESLHRSYSEAGYTMVAGSFELGGVLNSVTDVLLYGANNTAYAWLGALPKVVPPLSSPTTTGGISPSGDWDDVGDVSLRGEVIPLLTDTSNRALASYVYPDVVVAGVGASINPSPLGVPPLAYLGDVYHPPYNIFAGFTITSLSISLWGELLVGASTGQTYVYSRRETIESNQLVFGEEYLERFHRRVNLASGTNDPNRQPVKIVLSGDSTTVGVGASNDAFKPHVQLQSISSAMGYSYVTVVNKGVSGGSTYQWKDLWIAGELAENPDLLILRWGINDPATLTQTVETFEQSLREGLSTIRSQKTVAELSIVLMTPCTTDNEAGTRRVNEWHVAINRAIRRAARDYLCCFIDTHRILADAKNSAGIWMDNAGPTSTRVHPLDVLYTKIAQLMGKVIFPEGFTLARTNCLFNLPTWSGEYTGASDSSGFSSGITVQRFISADINQPINGISATIKHCEGGAIQMAIPYYGVTPGKQISFRVSYKNANVPGSLGNTLWTGVERTPTLQNGWAFPVSSYTPLRYKYGVDGEVKLVGTLNPGTLTAGTVLFNIPEAYLRPSTSVIVLAVADVSGGQQICQISVNSNGNVTYNGPTASVFRIHINGIIPI